MIIKIETDFEFLLNLMFLPNSTIAIDTIRQKGVYGKNEGAGGTFEGRQGYLGEGVGGTL